MPLRPGMTQIRLKRAYDQPAGEDGFRVLVDRLWPRGPRKDAARIDAWLKDVAPSTELRLWFGHEPARWEEFRKRYETELKQNPALDELRSLLAGHKQVTLLFGAKDEAHNNAVVLRDVCAHEQAVSTCMESGRHSTSSPPDRRDKGRP